MNLILWIICTVAIWIAYLVEPHVALMGLGLLFLAGPLTALVILIYQRKGISVDLVTPAVTGKNKPIRLSIEFHSKSKLPLGKGLVYLTVSNLSSEEIIERKLNVHRQEDWLVTSNYCGCLECRVDRLWCYDVFGIFKLKVPEPVKRVIIVTPNTFPVDVESGMSISNRDDFTEYSPYEKGYDKTETFQIRDYVPGDSLQQIHWKLSGKLDKLIVREGSQPVDRDLLVFVDRSGDLPGPEMVDALLEAATSVCQALTEGGIPFTLIWNQETTELHPVMTKDQFPEAISAMLKSRPMTEGMPASELYMRTASDVAAGRVLYFCSSLPPQDFFQGRAQYFLCGQADSSGVIDFGPSDMQEKLANIRWGW